MLDAFFHGFLLIFAYPTVLYLFGGILLGLWLGAVPGLGGVTGMIILLPFTFGMDSANAFALLLGMYAPVTTSDTIACVMLGIPGTAASQATILDGYPMARKGEATKALGAAFTVSAFGGVTGGLAMAISMPIAIYVILLFGAPEFFLLGCLGLVMVGAVSGNAISKGVAAAMIGLLLSQVGFPTSSETPRYTFDTIFLMDGFPLVPIVIGLFGLPEMIQLASRNASISEVPADQSKGGSILDGVRAAWMYRWLATRCALIGVYIGMLPGLGGAIADWVAYGHAYQSAKDKTGFGHGDIRGVIAPESCNNAVAGGALIPTLALGIPGSGAMAILLGAMIIHGLVPGTAMLTEHLDLTFSMVWTLIIANIFGAAVLMLWGTQVSKAAFVNGHLIVPGVISFVMMGAWLWEPGIESWYVLGGIAVVGWLMRETGWPRPPLVLGFILGPIMERNFLISYQTYTFSQVVVRPQALILVAMVLLSLVYAFTILKRMKNTQATFSQAQHGGRNPILSAPFALLLIFIFIWAFIEAQAWLPLGKLFPNIISVCGVLIFLTVLVRDWLDYRIIAEEKGSSKLATVVRGSFVSGNYAKAGAFFLLIGGLILLAPIIGQYLALLLFITTYLVIWGRFGWLTIAIYVAVAAIILHVLYIEILHIYFLPPIWAS